MNDYEREFGDEAEDLDGGQTYKAGDWQKAKTAYAYAITDVAMRRYAETAKEELTEGIEEFVDDTQRELELDEEPEIQFTAQCPHGRIERHRPEDCRHLGINLRDTKTC